MDKVKKGINKIKECIRKQLLKFFFILIVLFTGSIIFVAVVLYRPDLFDFQSSFSLNVSTVAMMVTAWATLILAFVTYLNMANSNQMAYDDRLVALARENRERKDHLLNEIIEWANDVNTEVYEHTLFGDNIFKNFLNLSSVSHDLNNRGRFTQLIAEIALKNEHLAKSIADTRREIVVFGACCRYLADGKLGGKFTIPALTKEQIFKYTKELDRELKLIKNNQESNIEEITGKLEQNIRDKANETLQICVTLKSQLLL